MNKPNQIATPDSLPVAQAGPGTYQCVAVSGEPESQIRLKRLGICESREITVLQCGDPMILRVTGAEIAVSRYLAEDIRVQMCVAPQQQVNASVNGVETGSR